ncbi:MAG: sulfur carrier protein ThiS adenylyltransferase ThiF [Spirochaetales bacterium]|nr:sulfur carrier protein ThiS adenylyltransferase ThiF [Spirochaetales bacterium]
MSVLQKNPLNEGLSHHIPRPLLDHFASVRIGIIGCGGLGSNCASMLVRSGFKKFLLMDGDRVEASNLNRQIYFPRHVGRYKAAALKELLDELSPNLEILAWDRFYHPEEEPDLFGECDYLVEAVDGAEVKGAILNYCSPHNKWIASASGLGRWDDISRLSTRVLGGGEGAPTIVMTGDGMYEAGPENPPLMPGVVTAAAAQVHALIKQAVKESGYDWS